VLFSKPPPSAAEKSLRPPLFFIHFMQIRSAAAAFLVISDNIANLNNLFLPNRRQFSQFFQNLFANYADFHYFFTKLLPLIFLCKIYALACHFEFSMIK
jgi:hypothetical protein